MKLKPTNDQENQVAEKIDANGQSTGIFVYASYINGVLYPVGYCAHGLCNHKSPEEAIEHWELWNEGWG